MQVIQLKPWQIWLAGIITIALVLAILAVAASVALVLVPVVLVVGGIVALLAKLGIIKRKSPSAGDGVIDATYVVIRDADPRQPDSRLNDRR